MKEIYSIEVTNYQTTNPKMNTVVVFFEDRVSANVARKSFLKQKYVVTRIHGHRVEGRKTENTVEAVNNLIGA